MRRFLLLLTLELSLCLSAFAQQDPDLFEKSQRDNLENFLKDYQAQDIISIDVIHIKHGRGLATMWGHSMMILKTAKEDYVFGVTVFSRRVNRIYNKELYSRMIFGKVPMDIQFDTLQNIETEYVGVEKRKVLEYELDIKKINLVTLLDQLKKWSQQKKPVGNYSFFGKNCATVLGRLIRLSAIHKLHGRIPISPKRLAHYFKKNHLLLHNSAELIRL